MNDLIWSFSQIWNESLAGRNNDFHFNPRDYIWASELGGSFIERWYKMRGIEPSNPYNARTLRKFEAGNVFEWIVEMVLKRAGILINKQEYVDSQYPGLLHVTGRLDHVAGGKCDIEKAKEEFDRGYYPDFIKRTAVAVLEYFVKKYPDGLKPIVFEVKSVGSQRFHCYNIYRVAEPKHKLQLFHYLHGKQMPEGHIVYISKDDLCLTEVGIFTTPENEAEYKKDIELMTGYFKDKKNPPPKENAVVFDDIEGRFKVNWKITYSQYLTLIYKYKDQSDFESHFKPLCARWNRVLGRLVANKDLTSDNKKAIGEMKYEFPNFDELLVIAKKQRKVKDEYQEEI